MRTSLALLSLEGDADVVMRAGVNLYHGNLVLDCQVPPKLLESCPRKDDREFTHMRCVHLYPTLEFLADFDFRLRLTRYTAATCDVSSLSIGSDRLQTDA